MRNYFQSLGKLIARQGVPFALSLVVTELFFELHSFSLELLCFTATWFVTGFVFHKIRKLIGRIASKPAAKTAAQ